MDVCKALLNPWIQEMHKDRCRLEDLGQRKIERNACTVLGLFQFIQIGRDVCVNQITPLP